MATKALVTAFCLALMFCTSYADARLSRARRADNCPTPPAPANGNVDCIPGDVLGLDIYCTFTCKAGYKFEGVTETDYLFVCDVATGFYDNPVTPPCIAHCASPCLNGGKCIAPDTCQCTGAFTGNQCEHSQNLCTDPPAGRFGTMNCQPDGQGGKICIPGCMVTFVFEKPAPARYTCAADGTWSPSDPSTVPDCIQDIQQPTTTTKATTVSQITGTAVCAAWGRNHYRTFDNKVFNFEGDCRYVYARVANTFEIQLVNDPNCATGGSCDRKLEIHQGADVVSLHPTAGGPEVTFNGQVMAVPGFKSGTIFEQIGAYTTVRSTLGYSIKWDGKLGVFLQVNDNLQGQVQGMCGNYNQDVSDEFTIASGQTVTTPGEFGSGWKIQEAGDPPCPDSQQPGGCSAAPAASQQHADNMCDVMTSDPDFVACHQVVDPTPYVSSCKEDCCETGSDSCMCDAMEAYSRACMNLGVKLQWRTQGRCEITCPAGKIYKECGSACKKTCDNVGDTCADPTCIDGCFCPDGKVEIQGHCILPTQCPCESEGHFYTQGDVIPKLCNNCTCNSGSWDCTHETCDKTCSATGDPHYETFDGTRYNFMGTCSYYLMKDRDFSIITDNIQCGHGEASCTKSITIDMNGLNIKLDHNHQVFVNGREITVLPYEAPGIKISMISSLFMQAVLDNGVTILWDGRTRAYIKAPSTFFGKTIGMCGTFDGNQGNDFMTLQGNVETNPNAFGNQWKTESSCSDMPLNSTGNPCDTDPQKEAQAQALCGNLNSDVFKDCHGVEPVDQYLEDCLYDLCACTENMKDCMCPNIGSYADTCAAKGIKINWRLSITECMLQCPPGQVYKVCGRPCERTCRDIALNEDELCDAKCVEGCNCPDGETLDDDGNCVPVSTCPCVFDSRTYPSGFTTLRGSDICVCEGGVFKCTKISISTNIGIDTADPLCPENTVYSDCTSNCPLTCENVNNPPTCSNADCKDGCECISGFALDGDTCVNVTDCPCYHGGKAFYDGQSYIQDCNECTCVGRQWQCTARDCPSICRAYGESHYTTFDGQDYEFHGQCDYILAQCLTNCPFNQTYTITTQNTQCGTSGVACAKQLNFIVGTPGTSDYYKLQLIMGQSVVPDPGSPFTVQEVGEMVYITTPFGITLQWDKGTRVYVQVSTDHINRVEGLCGNFNRDSTDDFTPRGGSAPVQQATIFGDSWKYNDNCAPSQEITDTCQSNPQRKAWAQLKCSVLSSDLFEDCHSSVDRTPYIKRCEYDACGCDLGGDCECLCTAIAAYAHECAIAGYPIKWRSQDLCPLQCEDCETFNPCMSMCPKKTCENYQTYSCSAPQGFCFEGCDLEPCPAGQIYSSLTQPITCIPEGLCESPFCEINGRKYHEGERVEDKSICRPECEICRCRSGRIKHYTFGPCDIIDPDPA